MQGGYNYRDGILGMAERIKISDHYFKCGKITFLTLNYYKSGYDKIIIFICKGCKDKLHWRRRVWLK